MKALMSDKLRKIIRDPKANKQLEDGISKLNAKHEEESTEISVAGHKYEIKFVSIEPNK